MFNITTTKANPMATPMLASTLTHTPAPANRLCGVALVPAGLCQYGDAIGPADVLRVDFDADHIDRDGLYLVEAMTTDGVSWIGCRRFERGINGLQMDDTGRGDWVVAGAGLRVAGRVEQVYRAV